MFHVLCSMFHDKLRIVFLGTPKFALPTLGALIDNNLKPILVVTQPDKPVGRSKKLIPSPVKQLALKNEIPVVQPETRNDLEKVFIDCEADVCVLAAYGMIIPKIYLEKPRLGFLNVHPSFLPKYRGASPIQAALLNGDQETGVSIIKLIPKMDAGPIVAQETVRISPRDNAETLHDKLAKAGADLLVKILPDYLGGKIKAKSQDEAKATYTKLIKREEGRINWQKKAIEIERQFKAFYPWPGVFTQMAGKRLKIANLGVLEGDFGPKLGAGEVFLTPQNGLAVKCGQSAVEIKNLQLEGKKEMGGQEFLQGHQDLIGKFLG